MSNIKAAVRLLMIAVTFLQMGLHLSTIGLIAGSSELRRLRAACIQTYLKRILLFAGLRIHARHPLPDERSFLLLANHVSYLDVIAIGSLIPIGFLAKMEISRWPVLGQLARLANSIFVDRACSRSRLRALRELRHAVHDIPYCVFPEGTTTAARVPSHGTWFRGNVDVARNSTLPVYVMGLHYSDQKEVAWIDDDDLLPHLWKTLKRDETCLVVSLSRLRPDTPAVMSRRALEEVRRLCVHSAESAFFPLPSLCDVSDPAVSSA